MKAWIIIMCLCWGGMFQVAGQNNPVNEELQKKMENFCKKKYAGYEERFRKAEDIYIELMKDYFKEEKEYQFIKVKTLRKFESDTAEMGKAIRSYKQQIEKVKGYQDSLKVIAVLRREVAKQTTDLESFSALKLALEDSVKSIKRLRGKLEAMKGKMAGQDDLAKKWTDSVQMIARLRVELRKEKKQVESLMSLKDSLIVLKGVRKALQDKSEEIERIAEELNRQKQIHSLDSLFLVRLNGVVKKVVQVFEEDYDRLGGTKLDEIQVEKIKSVVEAVAPMMSGLTGEERKEIEVKIGKLEIFEKAVLVYRDGKKILSEISDVNTAGESAKKMGEYSSALLSENQKADYVRLGERLEKLNVCVGELKKTMDDIKETELPESREKQNAKLKNIREYIELRCSFEPDFVYLNGLVEELKKVFGENKYFKEKKCGGIKEVQNIESRIEEK